MPYQLPPKGDIQEFEPLRPGKYTCVVEALELRYGSESGNPYVAWTFTVADGENKGRKLWNNTSLSEKAVNMKGGWYDSLDSALDFGTSEWDWIWGTEWDNEETMAEQIADAVCGRMVTLVVSQRRYQGKIQNDVLAVDPYVGELPQLDTHAMVELPTAPSSASATTRPASIGSRRAAQTPRDKETNF